MSKLIKILSPVIIIAGLFYIFKTKEIVQPPGILAPDKPNQQNLSINSAWDIDDFHFKAIANYEFIARVLSIKSYGYDDMSDFSPYDIAIGWQQMSDQSVIDKIDIKQQHRWYVWRTKHFPIPQKDIESSSANVHLIPANSLVDDKLDDIVRGQIISCRGKLVNVSKIGEKRTWKTSTKREDTGGGACEILWLENISVVK